MYHLDYFNLDSFKYLIILNLLPHINLIILIFLTYFESTRVILDQICFYHVFLVCINILSGLESYFIGNSDLEPLLFLLLNFWHILTILNNVSSQLPEIKLHISYLETSLRPRFLFLCWMLTHLNPRFV